MNVVVIGASAHSTPALFDSPALFAESGVSFTLVARNRGRLAAVGRAVDVLTAGRTERVSYELVHLDDLEAALAGAGVVVIQIRTGGYAARHWDEHFPHRYGQCGDEGLGLGGLAAAWRTWPELRVLLSRIASVKTNARILLLTSPVGLLTRCALEEFPQLDLHGICELPWTTLAGRCGPRGDMQTIPAFAYLGVNHLGWLCGIAADPVPLKYVALGDDRAAVLARQRAAPSRATELARQSEAAYRTYATGTARDIAAIVRSRATPWYAEAVAPFLTAMAGARSGRVFFLTHRNAGYCASLPCDAVIEMPYAIESGRLMRLPLDGRVEPGITERVRLLAAYETAAAEAVLRRDVRRLSVAIGRHPWLTGLRIDREIVADILADPQDKAPAELAS